MKSKAHNRQSLWDMAIQHCGSADAALDIAQLNGMMPTGHPIDGVDYQVPEPYNRTVVGHYSDNDIEPATQPLDVIPYSYSWIDSYCVEADDSYSCSWEDLVCVENEPYLFAWNGFVCILEAGWEFAWSEPECAVDSVSYDFAWTNPYCVQKEPPYNLSWTNSVCILEAGSYTFTWSNLVCAESPGSYGYQWANSICSQRLSEWPEWEEI